MKQYLFAIVLSVAGGATAQKPVLVPSPIAKIYAAQQADFQKGDWNDFFSYYDPTYVAIDGKGKKLDLRGLRAEVARDLKGTTRRSMRITFTDCQSTPTKVVVSFIGLTSSSLGKRTLKYKEVGTDTWMKKGKDWKEMKTVDKSFDQVK